VARWHAIAQRWQARAVVARTAVAGLTTQPMRATSLKSSLRSGRISTDRRSGFASPWPYARGFWTRRLRAVRVRSAAARWLRARARRQSRTTANSWRPRSRSCSLPRVQNHRGPRSCSCLGVRSSKQVHPSWLWLARLRDLEPVYAQGAAIASQLVHDGTGPAYTPETRSALRHALHAGVRALDGIGGIVPSSGTRGWKTR
jgi:hypothetical protein